MEKQILEDGQVHYELLYLIANKYSENELDPIKTKVIKMITDQGGKITLSQDWGKKRLAYTIKGFIHGYYQLLEFNLTPAKTKAVDNALRLSSEILRHQIVKAKIKTAEEIKAAVALREKIAAKEENNAGKQNSNQPSETKPEPTKTIDKTPTETKQSEDGKLELNDLDDKLNELLANDNLL